jgi:hypothetical protein
MIGDARRSYHVTSPGPNRGYRRSITFSILRLGGYLLVGGKGVLPATLSTLSDKLGKPAAHLPNRPPCLTACHRKGRHDTKSQWFVHEGPSMSAAS